MRLPLILVAILAGCVSPAASPSPEAPICPGPLCDPVSPTADESGPVGAPSLAVGLALTYASEQVYNPDKEFTIVVAKADEAGYLFAGAAEDDVVYAATWGDPFFGPHGRDLNPAEGKSSYFRWPLADGASWEARKGLTVRATAADVRVPGGTAPGFVVEGANERAHVRYEYAPAVGYFTSWLYESIARDYSEKLTLARVGEAKAWVWFEPAEGVSAYDPASPQTMDLASGMDAVLVSAGGAGGSRATVTMPDGSHWSEAFPPDAPLADGVWRQAALPPVAGAWTASTQSTPDAPVDLPAASPLGWAYVVLVPVKWVRS